MLKINQMLIVIGDKVKDTTSNRQQLSGSNPDESTYNRWSHVFSASSNALQTSEELMFFTFIVIMFFVVSFSIVYNIIHLSRVVRNIDGSLYQTKHIITKIVTILVMLVLEFYILSYIITVAKII